jgi:3-oxoacyl-[acyl-carrier protein] reductase
MMTLKDKTVLITGGSRGIGYGIAACLLGQSANVAITSRSEQSVARAKETLSGSGKGEVIGIVADVRNPEAQALAVDQVVGQWGKLDVLIANAGLGHFASIEDMTPEQWHETIDTNLTGVFNTVKAAIPALKNSKGYIITISSLAGTNFFPKGSAYNASKFGLVGFTQAIMLDLRNYGIKVTTIMPGSVATHFNNHEPSSADAWKIQPEDLGQIVADLLRLSPGTLPSKIEVRPTTPP